MCVVAMGYQRAKLKGDKKNENKGQRKHDIYVQSQWATRGQSWPPFTRGNLVCHTATHPCDVQPSTHTQTFKVNKVNNKQKKTKLERKFQNQVREMEVFSAQSDLI